MHESRGAALLAMTSCAFKNPAISEVARDDMRATVSLRAKRKAGVPVEVAAAFVIVTIVCAWFVTWGDWKFFEPERFCGFYDAQMRAMLHGRLDVPPAAIGFEAFIRDGKTYGYYGIGPALLRLPLLLVFPAMDGRWARILMPAACALNLVYAWRMVRLACGGADPRTRGGRAAGFLFLLCAGIGSSNVFLLSRSYTYHEAIMWGATFALMCGYYAMRYLREPSLRAIALAGVCAFLSFHSRPTTGAGALLVICGLAGVVLWKASGAGLLVRVRAVLRCERSSKLPPRPAAGIPGEGENRIEPVKQRRIHGTYMHAVAAILAIAITLGVYFAVNYGRFNTLDGVPVRYYGLYLKNPQRMAATHGKQLHLRNVPTGIASYWSARGVTIGREFPWLELMRAPRILGSPAIDVVEPYSSVPASMPALLMLAVIGCLPTRKPKGTNDESGVAPRGWRWPAAAMFLGGSLMLLSVGITQRYLHDYFPFLIIAGAMGVGRIASGRHLNAKLALLALLAVWSVAINCAFAIEFQRQIVWGVPDSKRHELIETQRTIDRFLPANHGRNQQLTTNN